MERLHRDLLIFCGDWLRVDLVASHDDLHDPWQYCFTLLALELRWVFQIRTDVLERSEGHCNLVRNGWLIAEHSGYRWNELCPLSARQVDGSKGTDHDAHIACYFFIIIAERGENMVSHGFLELRLGCDPCIARFLRLDSMAYRSEDRIAEYNTCEKACCLGILVCCEISSELV